MALFKKGKKTTKPAGKKGKK
jgi:hypothetical protein